MSSHSVIQGQLQSLWRLLIAGVGGAVATLTASAAVAMSALPSAYRTPISTFLTLPPQSVSPDLSRCKKFTGPRLYASTYEQSDMFVAVLNANANGDVNPICELRYSGFGNYIGGIALDLSNRLWVINSAAPQLMVFPFGSNGYPNPTQTIAGSNTLLVQFEFQNSEQITTDAYGNVWVPVWYHYNQAQGYVTAYARDANGNASPIATIGYGDKGQSEGIRGPVALAFDHHGNLYVADQEETGQVTIFSPPFTDNSLPTAMWTLPELDSARYLTIDSRDNVYVAGQSSIDVYAHGLKSRGVVSRRLVTPRSESVIAGIATDSRDRLYVSTSINDSIFVFGRHATSWFNPLRNIRSSAFAYGYPLSLAIGT